MARSWLALAWAMLLLVCGGLVQFLLPPLQSPDEFAHLARASSLLSGDIVMKRPAQQPYAGVEVDVGLADYFAVFQAIPYNTQNRLSQAELAAAAKIRWQGETRYTPAPGAAYYMPLIYLPQAAGLAFGKWLDFPVDRSYALVRGLTLLTVVIILAVALNLHPGNPALIALLFLPMSLFQWASPSLDGTALALAVLAAALFMRLMREGGLSRGMLWALAGVLVLLTTSRVHLLPLLLMLAIPAWRQRWREAWLLFFATTLLALGWTLVAIKSSYVVRALPGSTTTDIIAFYATQPWEAVMAIWRTLNSAEQMAFYLRSFVGILGWLDAPLPAASYPLLGWGLIAIALLGMAVPRTAGPWAPRLWMAALAIGSAMIVFLALLFTWNPLSPAVIEGIQGRYFTIPLILLTYAIGDWKFFDATSRRGRVATVAVLVFVGISLVTTCQTILTRYYLVSGPASPQPSVFQGL